MAHSATGFSVTGDAVIRRNGRLVVVGLPDAMGLFLYDLGARPDAAPLELSAWTAGMHDIEMIWLPGKVGVTYATGAADGSSSSHFVVSEASARGWQVAWFSDEDPDWWLSARNSQMSISPDLQTLTVVGEADHSSAAFEEPPGTPRRMFRVEWLRAENGYRLSPAPGPDSNRTTWQWQVAVPSAYATLVEFIERLRINDVEGAGHLVTDPAVVTRGFDFGLHFPENRFQVIAFAATQITFRSVRGTFIAAFRPPQAEDRPWLISSVIPMGAAPPTP
jgi:hypothetical protein